MTPCGLSTRRSTFRTPATAGDGETHDRILKERVMHVVVMLRSVLTPDRYPDVPWSTAYLRERLAEHPAEGDKTWQQRTAELEAVRKRGLLPPYQSA